MTIPIRPDGPIQIPLQGLRPIGAAAPDGERFSDLLTRAVGDVSSIQQEKEDIIAAFLRGDPVELHQVMAASEEASISLELMVEIRNKLADAYRSIMNMQA